MGLLWVPTSPFGRRVFSRCIFYTYFEESRDTLITNAFFIKFNIAQLYVFHKKI